MINCSFFYSSAGQTFAFISLEKRTSLIVFLHLVVVAMLFIHKNDRTKSNFTWQILKHDKSMGQRKNMSPWQEWNPWPPKHRVDALSTGLQEIMESKVS